MINEDTIGNEVAPLPVASLPRPAVAWLSANLRNAILLLVTLIVSYLALIGVSEARTGIVVTFTSLVSYLFAERASLKIPGKDS